MKSKFLWITTIALAILVAGMGFAGSASANAYYGASSGLYLTLTGVSIGDKPIEYGWEVYYENYWTVDFKQTTGDGIAANDYTPDSSGYMGIGDTVHLWTNTKGNTGLGTAESVSEAYLDVYANNWLDYDQYDQEVVFSFDYSYYLFAEVGSHTGLPGDDALAFADIDILDDFFSVDEFEIVEANLLFGPLEDHLAYKGSFSFNLASYEENLISAISSSEGFAAGAAPVPEPATMMLLAVGLVGFASLGAARRRKKP